MLNMIKSYIESKPLISIIIKPIYRNTFGQIVSYRKRRKLKKLAKEIFHNFDLAMRELRVEYWLEFGTLLGAVRDKGIIKHDLDIDVGIFYENYEERLPDVLKKYGFIRKYFFISENIQNAYEETYSYKGINFDIFYFNKSDDGIYCFDFMREKGLTRNEMITTYGGLCVRKILLPFKKLDNISLFDLDLPIPTPTTKHLSVHYGNNFMVYDPNWNSFEHSNCAVLIDYSGKIVEV